jgi:hypothetical protein
MGKIYKDSLKQPRTFRVKDELWLEISEAAYKQGKKVSFFAGEILATGFKQYEKEMEEKDNV